MITYTWKFLGKITMDLPEGRGRGKRSCQAEQMICIVHRKLSRKEAIMVTACQKRVSFSEKDRVLSVMTK